MGAVAFGDLEAEDSRNLTEVNFMRIFRLGQLTAEYLLHVQDRLAYDNCLLKARVFAPSTLPANLCVFALLSTPGTRRGSVWP